MTSEATTVHAGPERAAADPSDVEPYSRAQRPLYVDFGLHNRAVLPFPQPHRDAEPVALVPGVRLSPVLPIAVSSTPDMGRGVFATRPISAGEDFGRFALLEVPDGDPGLEGVVNHYVFGQDEGPSYLVLGWPSLMNHVSARPNVDREWVRTEEGWMLRFFAISEIEAGEQLLIDYGCEEWWAR